MCYIHIIEPYLQYLLDHLLTIHLKCRTNDEEVCKCVSLFQKDKQKLSTFNFVAVVLHCSIPVN